MPLWDIFGHHGHVDAAFAGDHDSLPAFAQGMAPGPATPGMFVPNASEGVEKLGTAHTIGEPLAPGYAAPSDFMSIEAMEKGPGAAQLGAMQHTAQGMGMLMNGLLKTANMAAAQHGHNDAMMNHQIAPDEATDLANMAQALPYTVGDHHDPVPVDHLGESAGAVNAADVVDSGAGGAEGAVNDASDMENAVAGASTGSDQAMQQGFAQPTIAAADMGGAVAASVFPTSFAANETSFVHIDVPPVTPMPYVGSMMPGNEPVPNTCFFVPSPANPNILLVNQFTLPGTFLKMLQAEKGFSGGMAPGMGGGGGSFAERVGMAQGPGIVGSFVPAATVQHWNGLVQRTPYVVIGRQSTFTTAGPVPEAWPTAFPNIQTMPGAPPMMRGPMGYPVPQPEKTSYRLTLGGMSQNANGSSFMEGSQDTGNYCFWGGCPPDSDDGTGNGNPPEDSAQQNMNDLLKQLNNPYMGSPDEGDYQSLQQQFDMLSGAVAAAIALQIKGLVQTVAAIVVQVVPPLIPPPVWINQPLPCLPMMTGKNCLGAVLYPITASDSIMADVADEQLTGAIASFPSTYLQKAGRTPDAMYQICFRAMMSMKCAAAFPMCTSPFAYEYEIPGLGRAPLCAPHCWMTMAACPGFWTDDIRPDCADFAFPPFCSMAMYLKGPPSQIDNYDQSHGFGDCPVTAEMNENSLVTAAVGPAVVFGSVLVEHYQAEARTSKTLVGRCGHSFL